MRLNNWLEEAMGSPTRVRVLRFLSHAPQNEYTLRDIARGIKLAPSSVSVALGALADQGFVEYKVLGRTHGYTIRGGAPRTIFKAIFDAESGILEGVEKALKKEMPSSITALLYGSAARGEDTPTSDLDIVVAAPTAQAAQEAEARVHAAIHAVAPLRVSTTMTMSRAKLATKRHMAWYANALRDGVLLCGPPLQVPHGPKSGQGPSVRDLGEKRRLLAKRRALVEERKFERLREQLGSRRDPRR